MDVVTSRRRFINTEDRQSRRCVGTWAWTRVNILMDGSAYTYTASGWALFYRVEKSWGFRTLHHREAIDLRSYKTCRLGRFSHIVESPRRSLLEDRSGCL